MYNPGLTPFLFRFQKNPGSKSNGFAENSGKYKAGKGRLRSLGYLIKEG
jgi:hypothetical protein